MAEKKVIELEVKDNVKSLKAQFAEAKKELQAMAAAYGENSQQAINAARKAAELKDIIDDSGEAIKNLQGGGTFQALSTSLSSVASGFGAVQGAVNLLGVESSQVEEALLKVQSAMALADGLKGLEDAKRSFGALGSTAINAFNGMTKAGKAFAVTGIGLIITAIASAIAYSDELGAMWDKLTGSSEDLRISQEVLNDTVKDYNKGAQEAIVKVNSVGSSFKLAQKGVISKEEALKTYNETLGDSLGKATSYNEAEKIYNKKTGDFIKATALRAQYQALLAKAAEEQANILTASMEDQTSSWDKFVSFAAEVQGNQRAADAYYRKAQKEGVTEQEKNSAKRKKIIEQEAQKVIEQAMQLEKNADITTQTENRKTAAVTNGADERKQALEELRKFEQDILDSRLSDEDKEIVETQRKYDEKFKLAKKYGQDTTLLEEGLQAELKAIRDKYLIQENEDLNKALEEMRAAHAVKKEDEADANAEILAMLTSYYSERKKKRDQQTDEEKQATQARVDLTLNGLQLVSEIADLFSKKDEASAKRAFQIQKAVSIAETTIKTIQGVQNAFTSASASPLTAVFPAYPFIQAATAGAFGAVQLAKIAQTKYEGSTSSVGSTGSSGSSSSMATTTAGGGGIPQFNISGNSYNQMNNLVSQTYVVSSQVTSAQELERKRIDTSVL